MDAWLLWLYGVVLKRLDLTQQAVEVLCQALYLQPMHWGAWLELAALITDREMVCILISSGINNMLFNQWNILVNFINVRYKQSCKLMLIFV